jgi:hypothetical protein
LQDYVFIPFPSLGIRYIFRQTKEFDDEKEDGDEIEGEVDEEEDDKEDDKDDKEENDKEDEENNEGDGERNDAEFKNDKEDEDEKEGDQEENDESDQEQDEKQDEQVRDIGSGDVPVYMPPFSEFDEEDKNDGGREDEEEDEEEKDENDQEEDEEQDEHIWDIGNGDFAAYTSPFSEFPLLKHHAHPFFVIAQALPKLEENFATLTPEQTTLLGLMRKIEDRWLRQRRSAPQLPNVRKRNRSDNGSSGNDDDYRSKRKPSPRTTRANTKPIRTVQMKTKRGRDNVDSFRGRTRQVKGNDKNSIFEPQQFRYPTPLRTSHLPTTDTSDRKRFLFDDESEVSAWIDAVAAAGPVEKIDEIIIPFDDEARPPIRNWSSWRHPYKQPKKRARFCSSDWAMYMYSIPLWTS